MRTTISELRKYIRRVIAEAGGGVPMRPALATRNPMSPDMVDREQLGYLADKDYEVDDDVSSHLRDPVEDPEDCFGPVPPTNSEPYVTQDPLVRDSSPLPTPIR